MPPRCLWEVENNLSTANMDFDDFCDCVDEEGIFRGFGDDTNSANPTLREHFDSVYSDYVEGEFPERRERFAGACVALGCLVSDEEISEQDVIRYLGNPDLPLTKIREDYNAMMYFYTAPTAPECEQVAHVSFRERMLSGISFGVKRGIGPILAEALEKHRAQQDSASQH